MHILASYDEHQSDHRLAAPLYVMWLCDSTDGLYAQWNLT